MLLLLPLLYLVENALLVCQTLLQISLLLLKLAEGSLLLWLPLQQLLQLRVWDLTRVDKRCNLGDLGDRLAHCRGLLLVHSTDDYPSELDRKREVGLLSLLRSSRSSPTPTTPRC